MPEPSEDQKLANERTDHLGRAKQSPDVPKESFEQGGSRGVEREAPQKRREGDVERV